MRKVPFPQANNLQMIFDIFKSIDFDGTSKYIIVDQFHLTDREARYYLDALAYLGIVHKQKSKYFLTENGTKLQQIQVGFLKAAFSITVLEKPFLRALYEKEALFIDQTEFKTYVARCIIEKEGLNFNTSMRRAGTILSWFEWINQHKE